MLFMIRLYISDEKSSEKLFLEPLVFMTISTTWYVFLTSFFSASPLNVKLFPNTQDRLLILFNNVTETSLHFFITFHFFVVDPNFRLYFMSSIELQLELDCNSVEQQHNLGVTSSGELDEGRIRLISDSR